MRLRVDAGYSSRRGLNWFAARAYDALARPRKALAIYRHLLDTEDAYPYYGKECRERIEIFAG